MGGEKGVRGGSVDSDAEEDDRVLATDGDGTNDWRCFRRPDSGGNDCAGVNAGAVMGGVLWVMSVSSKSDG